jgi:hypothetical protein
LVPLKIHTYKLDIFAEDPKWELDHTLPEHFGLKDLRPSEVESIADRIIKGDQELAVKFESGKANGGPETKIESCNLPCRIELYCQIKNGVYVDSKLCQSQNKIDLINDPIHGFLEFLNGPWY